MESSYLGGYWGSRAETVDDCTARLAAFLTTIGSLHPDLSTWYRKGGSRASALQSIALSTAVLSDLLLSGRSRTDIDGEVMDSLGFTFSAWNGDAVSLSVRCGASSRNGVSNSILLKFPGPAEVNDLYSLPVARPLVTALVEAWSPDWATWTTNAWRSAQQAPPSSPTAGWLSYLARPPETVEHLPAAAKAEPLGTGVLIRLGEDPALVTEAQVTELAAVLR